MDSSLDRNPRSSLIRHSHSSLGLLAGRIPHPALAGPRGIVLHQEHFSRPLSQDVNLMASRLDRCLQMQRSFGGSSGCSDVSMGSVHPDLHLYSSETPSFSVLLELDGGHSGDTHSCELAHLDVVL